MGIVEWISGRRTVSPQRLLQETEHLRAEGRSAEALRLVESAAGIEPADYEEPARALQKVRQWATGGDRKSSFLIVSRWLMLLADTPGPGDRLSLAAHLWELDSGLSPADYSDPERLLRQLRQRIEEAGLDPRLLPFHAGQFAASLGMANRTREELALLEAVLGLGSSDYSDPSRLSSLRLRPEGDIPDLRTFCIPPLIGALGKFGRRTEGAAVLRAALGLSREDLTDPARILAKTKEATGPFALTFLLLLPTTVRELGGGAAGLAALEADLDPDPDRYRNLYRLSRRLRDRLSGWPPDVVYFYIQALVVGFADLGRYDDALAIFSADFGLVPSDLDDLPQLTSRLRQRYRTLPRNVACFYTWLVAYVLAGAGLPAAAAAAIEADADLQEIDWRDSAALARGLEIRFGGLSVGARLVLVDQLASALIDQGREERAALLVDVYMRKLSPLGGADEEISLVRWLCQMSSRWLGWWGQDETRRPMAICHLLIPYVRRSLALRGMALEDREDFIREVGGLRRRIVQTGLYWAARETDPARAEELRRTVLLWDLELAQRLLVERFLLSEVRAVPDGNPPVTGVWPLWDDKPPTQSHLPDSSEVLIAVGVLENFEAKG